MTRGEGHQDRIYTGSQPVASFSVEGRLCPVRLSLKDLEPDGAFLKWFHLPGGVEFEIGCGKGRFLIRSAVSRLDTDFLGIERACRFFRVALARTEKRCLQNLKLIHGDASDLLELLPSDSLSAVHVLFPDPWHKRRHRKRRLFNRTFIQAVVRVLNLGGVLNLATDHTEYFGAITGLLRPCLKLRECDHFQIIDRLPEDALGLTNYEIKYRKLRRPIHQASWIRL